jgi:hypothetical protein
MNPNLQLRLTPLRREISTHESVTVHCELANAGAEPVQIPGPYDRSGALSILLRESDGKIVRFMNRQTRQRMLSDDRIDTTLDLDSITPGEQWEWPVDLASFHYLIPPGEFDVSARLFYPPADAETESEPARLAVRTDPIRSVLSIRDNPILDSLSLLIEAEGPAGRAFYLRQHNYGRPSGAWYSTLIPTPSDAVQPFFAPAGYYQSESFGPAFGKWIVTARGQSTVEAYHFVNGAPSARRKALLPAGAKLLPSAFHTADGDVHLFVWAASGLLECHRLSSDGLAKVFEHNPRVPAGTPLSIGAFQDSIHIATPWRGIVYERLDFAGRLLDRIHALRTGFHPLQISYEPGAHRIKGIFSDSRHAGSIQTAVVDLNAESSSSYIWDRFPLRHRLQELSFDQDRSGRFHLLASTEAKRLYYLSEERGPFLVAEGEERFHPVVCAPRKVYLGFCRRSHGFRFIQYQRRRQGTKLVGAEPHPAVV